MTARALVVGLLVVILMALAEETSAALKGRPTDTAEVILAGLFGLFLVSAVIEAAD